MIIRKYISADRLNCIEIFKSNCPGYFDPTEFNALELWLDGRDTGQLKYKTSEDEVLYVLELDEKVIACGGFYITKDKPHAHMAWGMVHNQFHKQGYGLQLLRFRLDEIKKLYPQHVVMLDTSQHTFNFFMKLGFVVTKITQNGYGPGLDRYDMAKENL